MYSDPLTLPMSSAVTSPDDENYIKLYSDTETGARFKLSGFATGLDIAADPIISVRSNPATSSDVKAKDRFQLRFHAECGTTSGILIPSVNITLDLPKGVTLSGGTFNDVPEGLLLRAACFLMNATLRGQFLSGQL